MVDGGSYPRRDPHRDSDRPSSAPKLFYAALFAAGAFIVWSFWTPLSRLAERWYFDLHYSHGFLVPVLAVLVLWFRRDQLPRTALHPSWWGLLFLGFAALLRLVAAVMDLGPVDAFALLPTLAGLALLVGGWPMLRWSWPPLFILVFMLPLPFRVEVALTAPLQRITAVSSTYLLQTCGIPAYTDDAVILIGRYRLAVVQACSGFGMVLTLTALATTLVFIKPRPLSDRIIIVASAIPVAMIVNTVRVSMTSAAYYLLGKQLADSMLHEILGWLMMPLALGLLWLEMKFLDRLFITRDTTGPMAVSIPGLAHGNHSGNTATP